jgi:Zn-dependent peptidase ImmA (M78 family)
VGSLRQLLKRKDKKALPKVRFIGTFEDVEILASDIRWKVDNYIGENQRLRIKLDGLVANQGGVIKYAKDSFEPSLTIYNNKKFEITLGKYHSPIRDNWTIIHELGHYFLHYNPEGHDGTEPVRFWRYADGRDEWHCNRFAAAFTMPVEEFKQYWKKYQGNIYSIGGHFEIPSAPVEIRSKYIFGDK